MTHPSYHATIDAIRADLATHFETLADAPLATAGKSAIIEYGATHIEPQPPSYQHRHGHWGQDWHEITLLDVFGQGHTLAEALRDWTKKALRMHLATEQATSGRALVA